MNKSIFLRITLILVSILITSTSFAQQEKLTVVTQAELMELIESDNKNTVILDVRTEREFKAGHIPLAINIPHKHILQDPNLLQKYADKNIVLYCHSGVRVGKVARRLSSNNHQQNEGKNIAYLKGNFRAWRARGLKIIFEN